MKRQTVWVAGIVVLAVALLVVLFATAPDDPDREGANPLVGKPAPSIEATDSAGRPLRLVDYRNRWLLVNFFATWCTPCKIEHPQLVAFAQEHQSSGDASVISVAYQEDPATVAQFFDQNGGGWPVVASGADKYALEYGVVKLPESFLIDPKGVVVHKFVGGLSRDAVDAEIAKRSSR